KSEQTAYLLEYFQSFIDYFRPGFVVVENVPGLLKHKDKSILSSFIEFLDSNDYKLDDGIIDASHYGVPQRRKRYLLIATRLKDITPQLPQTSSEKQPVVSEHIGEKRGLKPLKAGEFDAEDPLHRAAALSEKNLQRLKRTSKNGGDRRG